MEFSSSHLLYLMCCAPNDMSIQQPVVSLYCLSICSWDPLQFMIQEKRAKRKSKEARPSSAEIAERAGISKLDSSSSESFERRDSIESAELSNASASNVAIVCDVRPEEVLCVQCSGWNLLMSWLCVFPSKFYAAFLPLLFSGGTTQ